MSTDVQILLREAYEQAFGIYDHRNATNDHFALVRQHWSEDAIGSSRLRERIEAFLDNKVGQQLHMSFNEFISQPTYLCDLQLEILSSRVPAQEDDIKKMIEEFTKNNKQHE